MTALRDEAVLSPLSSRPGASRQPATARARTSFAEAERFLRAFHLARPQAGQVEARLAKVRAEIAATGTYRHTTAELAYGARMALRDSGWCPAGVPWRELLVRDLRDVHEPARVAAGCVQHLTMATDGGAVHPMVSVFAPDTPWRPGPRVVNDQLVRYAGYREPADGGRALGDRRYIEFTEALRQLGWQPPAGPSAFDVLPLVLETPGEGLTQHEIPRDAVLEVPLAHPELPWLASLGLRWHAVPVISNRRLRIGGVDYPTAPFNGMYVCAAIGEDVLADDAGYGLARLVADQLGLDTSSERTLWRDRAIVELNRAVLSSFDAAGVRIGRCAEEFMPPPAGLGRPAFLPR